jgi:hypothetical protein
MPKALVFIDANIYLKLYKAIQGRAFLEPLGELADGIIVTRQVVDEVVRNKLSVAAAFFQEQLQTFKPGLSDHLLDGEVDAARSAARTALLSRTELDTARGDDIEYSCTCNMGCL